MSKPGIRELLIRTALEPELLRTLREDPAAVFEEFDLSEEERELLRSPDHRLLPLLGAALARPEERPAPALLADTPRTDGPRTLPDLTLAVTVVPCQRAGGGYSYAAWLNPLAEGVDPATLPAPDGVTLPGPPMTALRAVMQISAIEVPDAAGGKQVGLSAFLRQSSNLAAPPPRVEEAVRPSASARTDIWIAGLGIQTATQLTREVEQALRDSREVLYLDTGAATSQVLESLCPRVTPLYWQSYSDDGPRMAAYEHMAGAVIEAALDHPPVTFAIHGHPLVAVHAPFLVLERARAQGLNVRVLPGISAIDTVLADLRIDPVVTGIQMYEATDLLLRRRPLERDVPAILWQIGPLETSLHTTRKSRPERFQRFVAYLRQFYSAEHQVVAIYCSPHPLVLPHTIHCALQDLPAHAGEIHAGFTLYVPPVGSRPILDWDLVEKLHSVTHLRAITQE